MLKFILNILLVTMAKAETINVVLLSDSMGAGVFSGSSGISTKDVEYKPREGSLLRKLMLLVVENHGFNWATGDVDYSIVSRIESIGFTVDAYNASISGAVVKDIVYSEIPSVKAWAKDKKINLFLVFIGGNDICSSKNEGMTDSSVFAYYYHEIADYVKDANAVVFVPLPDLTKLYDFKDNKCFLGFKCSKIWEFTDNCLNITRNQNLPSIRNRIMEYNEAIKNEAMRINAFYIDKSDMLVFEKKHVSRVDGFHPSEEGQRLISDLVWEKIGEKK